jgi:hypothetical protein
MLRDGRWPAMGPPFLPSLCDAGLDTVTKILHQQVVDPLLTRLEARWPERAPARDQRISLLRLTATDRRRRLRLFASQLAIDAAGSQSIRIGSRSLRLNRGGPR